MLGTPACQSLLRAGECARTCLSLYLAGITSQILATLFLLMWPTVESAFMAEPFDAFMMALPRPCGLFFK